MISFITNGARINFPGVGHGVGSDMPHHQPGGRADLDHRRRPRQGQAPG